MCRMLQAPLLLLQLVPFPLLLLLLLLRVDWGVVYRGHIPQLVGLAHVGMQILQGGLLLMLLLLVKGMLRLLLLLLGMVAEILVRDAIQLLECQ